MKELFIYIGDGELIASETLIAIVEKELYNSSPRLQKLIAHRKKIEQVFGSFRDAKSIVVTKKSIYYSPLATTTLKNRDKLYDKMDRNYGIKFD